jgi:hypothetical protein
LYPEKVSNLSSSISWVFKKIFWKKVCYDLVEGMTLGSSSFLLPLTNFK